jgi:hypothetical protein
MISCSSSSYAEEFMILNAGAAADQISIKIANLGNLQTNEILHSISTQKKNIQLWILLLVHLCNNSIYFMLNLCCCSSTPY